MAMGKKLVFFAQLASLFSDLRAQYPHWEEAHIVSQLRRSIPEYAHGVWSVALPFNCGESALTDDHRARSARLREEAIANA